MRLKGKVAIITGGAHSMGAAEARLFAKEGAAVVVISRSRQRPFSTRNSSLCEAEHEPRATHLAKFVEDLRASGARSGTQSPAIAGAHWWSMVASGQVASLISRSAFPCAIFLRSAGETGSASRNARARALEANG